MLVGIMSDSHGREAPVVRALALFDALGVEYVIHCGDVGGTAVLDHLVGRRCAFVWGNTDWPSGALRRYLHTVGLPQPPDPPPLRLKLDDKLILVFHGHEPDFAAAVVSGGADYVLHGHTHAPRDERVGRTRIINPGALFRAARKTVAALDTATDALTIHDVGKE